jgi:hypothetical protein
VSAHAPPVCVVCVDSEIEIEIETEIEMEIDMYGAATRANKTTAGSVYCAPRVTAGSSGPPRHQRSIQSCIPTSHALH